MYLCCIQRFVCESRRRRRHSRIFYQSSKSSVARARSIQHSYLCTHTKKKHFKSSYMRSYGFVFCTDMRTYMKIVGQKVCNLIYKVIWGFRNIIKFLATQIFPYIYRVTMGLNILYYLKKYHSQNISYTNKIIKFRIVK